MAIDNPIQLNYADAIALRPMLVPRCTWMVSNFALYILGNGVNGGMDADPNAANFKAWAKEAINNAGSFGDRVSWYVLNNSSFLNGGTSIADGDLQNVVENSIKAFFVAPLP